MANVETAFDSGLAAGRRNAPEFFTYSNVDTDGAFQADAITAATSGTIYKSPAIVEISNWNDVVDVSNEFLGSGLQWVSVYGQRNFNIDIVVYSGDMTFLRQVYGNENWRVGFWIPDKGGWRPIKLNLCTMSCISGPPMSIGVAHKRTIRITPRILESATADAVGELGKYGASSAVVTAIPTFSGLTDVI